MPKLSERPQDKNRNSFLTRSFFGFALNFYCLYCYFLQIVIILPHGKIKSKNMAVNAYMFDNYFLKCKDYKTKSSKKLK